MGNGAFASARSKLRAACLIVLASMALTLVLEVSGLLEPYSLKTLDLLFRHVPLPRASTEVVVATVDQPDLDFFKKQGVTWPWPRQLYSHLIDYCRQGGARAVVFDVLFTEPSSYGPDDDQRLAQAAANAGNVVLPFFLSRDQKAPNPAAAQILEKAGLQVSGPGPQGLPPYTSIVTPIAPLMNSVSALGNVESSPDADGIYRRVPLVASFQGRWLPILPFAAYLAFGPGGDLRFGPGRLDVGAVQIPLDGQGRFLLKYRGPSRSHQRFSAANIIASEARLRHNLPPIYPPEAFAGKWVLVGLTAPGLLDLKASPVSPIYPGVEVHATVLDNLLRGDFLRAVPWWLRWLWGASMAALAALAVFYSTSLALTLAALAFLVAAQFALAAAFWLGWWADPVPPGVALGLSFSLAAAYSYATEGRQKRYIRGMFGQYMSETVVNHLLEHPEKLKLGGERRHVTLFFSDLAGFTGISERLEAEAVVGLLNDYLSLMTQIIMDAGGAVDKFEGDAIMAFWGAPLDQADQAVLACRAALGQRAGLAEINRRFGEMGLPQLRMRIGLHTGPAIVGNLGSQKRFDYTVIGDTVNLASRLEGLNKFYGTTIMASEVTAAECGPEIEFRELDLVAVKGRATPVRVFEVLALKGELAPETARLREDFAPALEMYRQGQFEPAAARFRGALELFPDDGPSRVFLGRCQRFLDDPTLPRDPVFRPDSK